MQARTSEDKLQSRTTIAVVSLGYQLFIGGKGIL